MKDIKKILLCGASGFIGSHIFSGLNGEYIVMPFHISAGQDMCDFSSVREAVYQSDIVLHFCAGAVGQRNIKKNPGVETKEYKGTENFARASAQAGVPFVYASSIRVYGTNEQMEGGEDANVIPVDPYGKMKFQCERIVQEISKESDLQYVILRMSAVYGPGMPHDFVVSSFFSSLKQGKPIHLSVAGDQKRNFIFVDDVVQVIIKLLKWEFSSNQIFNIASNEPVTLLELISLMKQVVLKDVPVTHGGRTEHISEASIPIARAKSAFGWEPSTSLINGLQKTYALL